jgi:hypothetical protein
MSPDDDGNWQYESPESPEYPEYPAYPEYPEEAPPEPDWNDNGLPRPLEGWY